MRRFNVAWWAYSFPLTILAHAATRYAQEVKANVANLLMLVLSVLSVIVTLALIAFTAIKTNDILPQDDPFDSSSVLPTRTTTHAELSCGSNLTTPQTQPSLVVPELNL